MVEFVAGAAESAIIKSNLPRTLYNPRDYTRQAISADAAVAGQSNRPWGTCGDRHRQLIDFQVWETFCYLTRKAQQFHNPLQYRSIEKRGTLSRDQSSLTELLDRALIDNDPSAGSPTETLLRLLLPLGKYHKGCFQVK